MSFLMASSWLLSRALVWEGEDGGYFLLLVYCMCDHLEEQKWQDKVD